MTLEELKDLERRIKEGRHYTERDLLLLVKEVFSFLTENRISTGSTKVTSEVDLLKKEIESLQNELACLKDELFKLIK